MSSDQIQGVAKKGVGHVQDAVGGLVGDDGVQAKGKVNEAAGALQDVYGQVKSGAKDALDQAQGALSQAGEKAQGALGQARDKAGDVYGDVEAYLGERPLVGVAIGAAFGFIIGLSFRGQKTVYLRK